MMKQDTKITSHVFENLLLTDAPEARKHKPLMLEAIDGIRLKKETT